VAVCLLFFVVVVIVVVVVMVDGVIISIYNYISILFIGYKHTSRILYTADMTTPANHVRNQRRNQNARQATMISGLNTIYRNQTTTHAIQTHQQTEPRIFLLDITLEEMNQMYSKIHAIIEKGSRHGHGHGHGREGSDTFFVYKKEEHMILSEDNIYEIRYAGHSNSDDHSSSYMKPAIMCPQLIERIPVDGTVTTIEMCISTLPESDSAIKVIPLLVDESYYRLRNTSNNNHIREFIGAHISSSHIVDRYTKIIVKLHPKSMNSFVFIMNEKNGIIENSKDKITTTCKEYIISFIDHFKLCS